MFGRGMSLALAAGLALGTCSPNDGLIASRLATHEAVLPAARPAAKNRKDAKRRDRRASMGPTYGRGNKLARRLRRKFELGRSGAF